MRWWLAAVFVAIATLTAVLIAVVSSRQADRELRANAENIALGAGISARSAVSQAIIDGNLEEQLPSIGARHSVALFVFSPGRRLIASGHYKNVRWEDVPEGAAAVLTALGDRRYVAAFNGGRSTLVALPLDRRDNAAVLVAYAPKPPYGPSLAIFRHDVVQASIYAVADRRAHRARRRDADRPAPEAHLEGGRGDRAGRLRARARGRGCTTRSATSRSPSTACARSWARPSSS